MSLLSAVDLSHSYSARSIIGSKANKKNVLNKINLSISQGETVGLLGRSGCGKSTLARLLVGVEKPNSGEVLFEGQPLNALEKKGKKQFYRTVQMIFQDSVSAVNPRYSVGEIIAEPLKPLCGLEGEAARARVYELLKSVQLKKTDYDKRPSQMSGGQLQRVCIARALGPSPQLIVLDEAVSSLDLHLQAQMLELFEQLQAQHSIAYLFVTHDLRLVERFCTRLVVMDKGEIVENTTVSQPLTLKSQAGNALFNAVLSPYPRRSGRL